MLKSKKKSGWGTGVIENLAKDLQREFPGIQGFSRSNIFRMRAFYLAYEKISAIPRQLQNLPIFNIPWWHNVILLTKLKNNEQRIWYAQKSLEYGWSSIVLEMQIESDLYRREGKAINNFKKTLPSPQSDIAKQAFKDPYLFDFLTLQQSYIEKDIEQGLIDNIQKFLLEMGKGFAFMGRQVHLHVDDEDYYLDLLFYNVNLHCYCIVELKSTKFKPEYAGKMAFYLTVVDKTLKTEKDNPTIGLILCKTKNILTVEYALRTNTSPIGVAEYTTQILEKLPKEFKSSLPTVEEIEAELEKQNILTKAEKKIKK